MPGMRQWCGRILVVVLGAAGCRGEEGRVLRVAGTVSLGTDSASTLAVDSAGRYWLGMPGGMVVRDSSGIVARIDVGSAEGETPRMLGWKRGRAYLRRGESVLVAVPGEDSIRARRPGFDADPVLLDVRGRVVLQGAGSGAVLAYDPETLEPLWAWPALALRSTAMAASPQGDRIYQALGTGEDGHRVLIRDLQTGRVLGTEPFPAPFQALVSDGDGVLYGVAREGGRAAVLALRPREGKLELLWRHRLPSAGEDAEVRLAVAAGRVAIWGPRTGMGLRLLDARDGAILARTRSDPLDFAFGPGVELWALYPGVLRRLR